jgi:hypothetical protein
MVAIYNGYDVAKEKRNRCTALIPLLMKCKPAEIRPSASSAAADPCPAPEQFANDHPGIKGPMASFPA